MKIVDTYREDFTSFLNKNIHVKEPNNLYEPIHYILRLGGKRLRPVLTMMACDFFNGNVHDAYEAALAVEVFHNFTLVHDDIMDSASVRRGKATVHKKWDVNTAILSGDAMLIMAYRCFEKYEPEVFKKLIRLFNKTSLQVCEGQQLDMDFETRNDVQIDEYLKMISFKTAVLLAAAMKMGAIIANATAAEAEKIYDFGLNLGIAFQLQDDYLDTFGEAKMFGKKIGGDISENKKTFLYLKAMDISNEGDKKKLYALYNTDKYTKNKRSDVTRLFEKNQIPEITVKEIESYTNKAFEILESLSLDTTKKEILQKFGLELMKRTM
jgi:geranylgeranyl diphosphate synthase type II